MASELHRSPGTKRIDRLVSLLDSLSDPGFQRPSRVAITEAMKLIADTRDVMEAELTRLEGGGEGSTTEGDGK